MLLAIKIGLQRTRALEDSDDMNHNCRFGLMSDFRGFADRLACPFVVLDCVHP